MEVSNSISQISPALRISVAAALLAILSAMGVLSDRSSFVALTLMLIMYLWLEVVHLRRSHPDLWLLNPIVFCSFMTFLMGYGATNVLFFMPENQISLLGLVPEVSPAMVKLMWLVLIGAVAIWQGYWSPIAAHFSGPEAVTRFQAHFLPKTNSLKPFALLALVSIAIGARLIQIKLGVFGYSSSYDRLIEMGAITQYLTLASGLGKLALVLAAIQYYSAGTIRQDRNWFYGLLLCEVAFGLLSGFKSAVVMPLIIVAICQFLRTGRFSKAWVIWGVVGIMGAYAVIEPFRHVRSRDIGSIDTSVSSIAGTMINAADTTAEVAADQAPLAMAIASRSNLSYVGSIGVAFRDDNPSLPEGSPAFLDDILLAPLHAFIPRLLWAGKPLGNLGLWYEQVVMGRPASFSASAMGPFTYLYFAGGFVAVFIGFFFIGVTQRCLFFLLQPKTSFAGGVVFLSMLTTLTSIDSSFNGIVITLCRELPLVILLQFLLFRNHPEDSDIKAPIGAQAATN